MSVAEFRGARTERRLSSALRGGRERFGGSHSGIVMFVFCDGSTRAIRTSLDGVTLRRFAVRNDGEVANAE